MASQGAWRVKTQSSQLLLLLRSRTCLLDFPAVAWQQIQTFQLCMGKCTKVTNKSTCTKNCSGVQPTGKLCLSSQETDVKSLLTTSIGDTAISIEIYRCLFPLFRKRNICTPSPLCMQSFSRSSAAVRELTALPGEKKKNVTNSSAG